ncbi:MAG TPA: hypothetical protein VKG44_04310 [Candidatus Baltobacteraceae bacterium]|nr:hypothetical protein [Candidatus Baltobacteraceae bacterium]
MALAQLQHALAALFTDARERERLVREPSEFARRYSLDPQELTALGALPAGAFRGYADSLERKRVAEVAKLLPRSADALGPAFRRAFFHYARSAAPSGPGDCRRDARRFARHLQRLPEGSRPPARILALLRRESGLGRYRFAFLRRFLPALLVAACSSAVFAATPAPGVVPTPIGCKPFGPSICETYSVLDLGKAGVPVLVPAQLAWLKRIHATPAYASQWKHLRFVARTTYDGKLPLIVFDARGEAEIGLPGVYHVIGEPCTLYYHPDEDTEQTLPGDSTCRSTPAPVL